MLNEAYRYRFGDEVCFDEVLGTIDLSILAVQSLHGEARTRLDARFVSDTEKKSVVIDATSSVGDALNQIFVGFARREFGLTAFRIERLPAARPSLRASA